jgi:hypothetical protein
VFSPPKAAPLPVLGALDEPGAQRVALDVSTDRDEVIVRLNGKGLESALVQVAAAHASAMRVPSLRVRHREPCHERRQAAILLRGKDQVPVRWHNAIREQADGNAGLGLGQNAPE